MIFHWRSRAYGTKLITNCFYIFKFSITIFSRIAGSARVQKNSNFLTWLHNVTKSELKNQCIAFLDCRQKMCFPYTVTFSKFCYRTKNQRNFVLFLNLFHFSIIQFSFNNKNRVNELLLFIIYYEILNLNVTICLTSWAFKILKVYPTFLDFYRSSQHYFWRININKYEIEMNYICSNLPYLLN